MNLIQRIKKFLGLDKPMGRPRIPIEKRLAIKGAPMHVTDAELARILNVSYATIHRYRHHNGTQPRQRRTLQIQSDSPPAV
jgi:hypothetical protein